LNIGIFDSGIGGMTLLHQALVSLPDEKYIFYADTDHVPYGTKTRQQVVGYVDEVMQFMKSQYCNGCGGFRHEGKIRFSHHRH
jgi:glutamate racemase